MAVYINMEMPTSCAFCRFSGAYCYAKGDEDVHSTLPCPLVHVPPHGRCIDADALENVMSEGIAPSEKDGGFKHPFDIIRAVANAPTIIQASEEA